MMEIDSYRTTYLLKKILWVAFFMLPLFVSAQNKGTLSGTVKSNTNEKLPFSTVYIKELNVATQTNDNGNYQIKNIPYGNYTIEFSFVGYEKQAHQIIISKPETKLNAQLKNKVENLTEYEVEGENESVGTIRRMQSIDGVILSEGKKSEIIVLDQINANKATNQGRQIYSRIPGLNIWESDGAGLQLGIGGRGLNPSRSSNFNTRQNGYDISADALGYPESYYTPPAEAIKEIQFLRGAASLQFGTQFGGLLNFKLHDGPIDKDFELTYRITKGSFNLSNSFISAAFKEGAWKGYGYFQLKKGNEFRPNSGFEVYTGAINITNQITEKTSWNLEYTKLYYLAQQPGGLTDKEFYENPYQSKRARNWFEVDWNLFAASLTHEFNAKTKVKTQFFGLHASRKALGILGNISRPDFEGDPRDLIIGEFQNFGNETRLLNVYSVKNNQWAFVLGGRYYQGLNKSRQGNADTTSMPNFTYVNPDNLEGSDYRFPSRNYAAFAEHIFRFKNLSITPGVRFEYINTNAKGTFREVVYDLANNPIFDTTFTENRSSTRSFVIGGIGLNYKIKNTVDIYSNFTQNYRSINFADMQIVNRNLRIDPDLKDETGYNFDVGVRGIISKKLSFDVSGFVLLYDNRIGSIDKIDESTFIPYRYRTNISEAVIKGVESTIEVDVWKLAFSDTSKISLTTFVNFSLIDAKYVNSQSAALNNKLVEFVPPINFKTGVTFGTKNFAISYQYTYVQEHYTDATNAGKAADGSLVFIPTAIIGTIPSYSVMDLSLRYTYEVFQFEFGVNNLTNSLYFTRRATGYPGPGIIPSPVRNYYFTLQMRI